MPQMAAQHAPQQAPKGTGTAADAGAKRQEKRGVMQRLHDLPQAAGVITLVLMLVAALFVGNARALFRVSPGAFLKQGDVASIIEDRLDAAGNALTVASRSDISQTMLDNAREAMDAMEQAQTAREISRSDQRLTSAVSEMVAEASKELEGEDLTMITRAADDFAEQGSFLRQEARAYNEQALKAEALYEKLPTAFVLPEPDVYEGI